MTMKKRPMRQCFFSFIADTTPDRKSWQVLQVKYPVKYIQNYVVITDIFSYHFDLFC